ncbi:malto-oligosyltrehalose trehalohydrolase [Streptomyces radicis]|uniref:Malto-oligosyltrehalose trehalohydrolase n=1 Tax=Streptomyces radicis TaxID=1750517 RepID=A0A3A9VTJ8_9ACTN|nr:malto-oligosyltrehalose trehalohydrolase [Streptomyces radicis]RKN04099.1 malto-oligosyltrehalose trehalohydrolase [Streptomyces radicis]RKN14420.1 malto-oligosyltrehalose trehalohydrolase [Streptomyces radicis]
MLFDVWAPWARQVTLHLSMRPVPMERDPDRVGWWVAEEEAGPGARYGFALDDGPVLPDPRARRLPEGPEGPAAVTDPGAFPWRHDWAGRGLPGAVLYETHIGTFTPEGTFDAAAGRLGHVAALGVTHVELMPVCAFPGRHGWGYDGVAPWSVHEPYGGPEGLQRFVDTAHGHGLGVVLDVVHNHLGPSGNRLPEFGPYFTEAHHTPWGAAVNLDEHGSDEVRAYFVGSALAFLRDYRVDGLRLDAVHALVDNRAEHVLAQLSAEVDALSEELGRPLFLIGESDRNDPRTTAPRACHGHGLHAQWNDDFHHALHCAVTGESQGYYADFARAPLATLAKTLERGFFHDGGYSAFRGRRHGRPFDRAATPAHRLLGYAQTHDQVGNRALGDRVATLAGEEGSAIAAALVLCGPFTPMLFMGEEWGAVTPWQYFTDHQDPELAEAVRNGRRREFGAHGWPAEEIPDPQDPATRDRSCLDWSRVDGGAGTEGDEPWLLGWCRRLIAIRHAHLPPGLTLADVRALADDAAGWLVVHNGPLTVAVHVGEGGEAVVPLGDGAFERLATTHRCPPPEGSGVLRLPPRAAAVLRRVAE